LRAPPEKKGTPTRDGGAMLDENGLNEPQSPSLVVDTGVHLNRFQRGWYGKVDG
jgi:hypothetical protein